MLIIFYFFVIQIDLSDFPIWFNFFEKCFINFTSFRIFLFWFVLIAEKGIREITTRCLLFEKCLQIQTSQLALNFSVSAYLSIYNLCSGPCLAQKSLLTWNTAHCFLTYEAHWQVRCRSVPGVVWKLYQRPQSAHGCQWIRNYVGNPKM